MSLSNDERTYDTVSEGAEKGDGSLSLSSPHKKRPPIPITGTEGPPIQFKSLNHKVFFRILYFLSYESFFVKIFNAQGMFLAS